MPYMTENEVNSRDLKSVDKFIKVLKYLNIGGTLKLSIGDIKIAERTDGSFGFIIIAQSFKSLVDNFNPSTRVLGVETDLVMECIHNEVSDDDVLMLLASVALTKMNRER